MIDHVTLLLLVLEVVLLLGVLELVRRHWCREEYALPWLLGIVVGGALCLKRSFFQGAAIWLGLDGVPAMLLWALGPLVILGALALTVVISRQRATLERLIEDVAILSAELQEQRSANRPQV